MVAKGAIKERGFSIFTPLPIVLSLSFQLILEFDPFLVGYHVQVGFNLAFIEFLYCGPANSTVKKKKRKKVQVMI